MRPRTSGLSTPHGSGRILLHEWPSVLLREPRTVLPNELADLRRWRLG